MNATDATTPAGQDAPEVEGFALDGISYLIAVTQMKSNNATDDLRAVSGAVQNNMAQKQRIRQAQRALDTYKL